MRKPHSTFVGAQKYKCKHWFCVGTHGFVIFLKLTHMYMVRVLDWMRMIFTFLWRYSIYTIQVNQHFYHVPFEPYNIFVSGPQAFGFDVRDY